VATSAKFPIASSRRGEAQQAAAADQPWFEERTRVAVERGVHISGNLVFGDPMRIEGSFKGDIRSVALLVIGPEGRVEGAVKVPRLLVLGELRGGVTEANRVVLGPQARMHGQIEARSVIICEGASFNGHIAIAGARAGEP
jgi:cytoskeletal protein CcmA (bactofilin family)